MRAAFADAKRATGSAPGGAYRDYELKKVADVRARTGDFAGAVGTAERIGDPRERAGVLLAVAEAWLAAKNSAGARDTLSRAEKATNQVPHAYHRAVLLLHIAVDRAAVDDREGSERASSRARQLLITAKREATPIHDPY